MNEDKKEEAVSMGKENDEPEKDETEKESSKEKKKYEKKMKKYKMKTWMSLNESKSLNMLVLTFWFFDLQIIIKVLEDFQSLFKQERSVLDLFEKVK